MKKLMMAVMLAACAANVPAMPTKQEMAKAQPLVAELMAPALAKFKAAGYKEKTAEAAKVGDVSSAFAKAAETEAAKFLLLKGSVGFYVRGEQYDKAADTIETLRREVKDVTPAVIAEITEKAAGKSSKAKAPRLYALYRSAKLQVRAGDEAKTLAAKLKKVKSDALQRKYAEALAVSGDWKAAYAEFAKVNNAKLKEIVKSEAEGNAKSAEAGEFWWTYEPAMEDAEDFFKSHAAAFYRRALEAGEITGLKKNIIEQRIKGIAVGEASCLPMVRQDAAPTSSSSGKAWQEKGNTAWLTLTNGEKLEFAKCPAGTVDMRIGVMNWTKYPKTKKVRISRPFWVMVSPLARRHFKGYPQWSAMFGSRSDDATNYCEGFYEDFVSFADSITDEVKNNLPQGYIVRLPSFAEWDYSFRAGSRDPDDPYANFDVSRRNENIARCKQVFFNGGCFYHWGEWYKDMMGKTKKNNWGLHDYWREKLIDKVDSSNAIPGDKGWHDVGEVNDEGANGGDVEALNIKAVDNVDPLLWSENAKSYPLVRQQKDHRCVTAGRKWSVARLVVGPDLVGEWRAKHGKK